MAISIGKGNFPPGADRRLHMDQQAYAVGDQIMASFKQLDGPDGLRMSLQVAEGSRSLPSGDEGWTTVFELLNIPDSDTPRDAQTARLALPDRPKIGTVYVRAVVYTTDQSREGRTYRLHVAKGKS